MSAWTQEDDDKLRKLWDEGDSCSVIARSFPGRTRNAIIGRVRRIDLPMRGYRPGGIVARRNAGLVPRKPKKADHPWRPDPKPLSPAAQVIKDFKRDGLPLPTPAETDVARVSFLDLERHHCRFITLAEPAGPFVKQFCGERVVLGLPYCAAHVARCYGSPNPSRPAPANRKELQVA